MSAPASIGAIRDYLGQRYTVVANTQRARRDGTIAAILIWASECAHCGEIFTCTTPAASAKFQPNRRCQHHKRPGHRVKARCGAPWPAVKTVKTAAPVPPLQREDGMNTLAYTRTYRLRLGFEVVFILDGGALTVEWQPSLPAAKIRRKLLPQYREARNDFLASLGIPMLVVEI